MDTNIKLATWADGFKHAARESDFFARYAMTRQWPPSSIWAAGLLSGLRGRIGLKCEPVDKQVSRLRAMRSECFVQPMPTRFMCVDISGIDWTAPLESIAHELESRWTGRSVSEEEMLECFVDTVIGILGSPCIGRYLRPGTSGPGPDMDTR